MYAVFRTGGKQYRASKGDRVMVERLQAEEGESVEFSEVLLVGEGSSVKVGSPLVLGSKVQAKVITQGRGSKITVIKFKRRKNYKRVKGHRQHYTEVEITSIIESGSKKTTTKKAATKKATTKKAATKKAATKKATTKKATTKKATTKKAAKTSQTETQSE